MQKENVCPICGEPTYLVYGKHPRKDGLCYKHSQMLFNKEVEQCPDCKKWHNTNEICDCKKSITPHSTKGRSENEKSDITCIICGEPSNGKHFCRSCYTKYKDKIVYLQVKKCTEFFKLEAEYQSELTCDDGHMVKSLSEKIIDDWLFKEKINHAYETVLDIDESHDIHPDFYIPEYNGINDIYIEFWGFDESNVKYTEIKKYKQSIYPKLCNERNITVLYLSKADLNNANATLKKKLKYLKQGIVNE